MLVIKSKTVKTWKRFLMLACLDTNINTVRSNLYLANLEHGDQLIITLYKTVQTLETVSNFYNAWIPT